MDPLSFAGSSTALKAQSSADMPIIAHRYNYDELAFLSIPQLQNYQVQRN
jgi:hypothetical protein